MRKLVFLLALLLPLACASTSKEAAHGAPDSSATSGGATQPAPGKVDGATAHQLVSQDAVLVDVRTPEEYAAGHVEGAVNVPVDAIEAGSAALPRDKPVVVY